MEDGKYCRIEYLDAQDATVPVRQLQIHRHRKNYRLRSFHDQYHMIRQLSSSLPFTPHCFQKLRWLQERMLSHIPLSKHVQCLDQLLYRTIWR